MGESICLVTAIELLTPMTGPGSHAKSTMQIELP